MSAAALEPWTVGPCIAGIGGVTLLRRRRKVQKAY
jgi:hypothetical protein